MCPRTVESDETASSRSLK